MSMMTHHVQVQPPVQQVVQGGCYTQPDLSQQFGTLSLQDPAFIQELQRIETQKYQNYPPQVPVGPGGQHVDPMYGGQQQQAQPVPMGAVPMGGGSTGKSRDQVISDNTSYIGSNICCLAGLTLYTHNNMNNTQRFGY